MPDVGANHKASVKNCREERVWAEEGRGWRTGGRSAIDLAATSYGRLRPRVFWCPWRLTRGRVRGQVAVLRERGASGVSPRRVRAEVV
eukprot:728538-Pyramimonas_sp.AAC.1